MHVFHYRSLVRSPAVALVTTMIHDHTLFWSDEYSTWYMFDENTRIRDTYRSTSTNEGEKGD